MVQVSGGQLITPSGQPIMVQAVPGGQTQTIMQLPVTGSSGLQQVSRSIIKELIIGRRIAMCDLTWTVCDIKGGIIHHMAM